jgi:glycosyltransferase involved in cell wall biosynthesis
MQDKGGGRIGKLLVIAQLPPPVHGASVINQIVVTSDELRRKFDISVVPIDATTELSEIRKFSTAKVLRTGRLMVRVFGRLLFDRPELAYLTMAPKGFAFYRDAGIVLLFRFFRQPHVLHFHGRGMRSRQSGKWSSSFTKYILREATIVHLSPSLFSDISPFAQESQVRFVANGVADFMPPTASALLERQKRQEISILFLSTMLESKGPLVLLRALEILKREQVPFTANFAGPWRGSLTPEDFHGHVARAGLADVVRHLGPVYGEEKRSALARADILAFPTNYENEAFPLVVLEGMAAGLAPVTSSIAALPDIVADAGICVPPDDPPALAAALKLLITDRELLNALQVKARAKYEAEFTQQRFEAALAEVLSHATAEGRKPAGSRTA